MKTWRLWASFVLPAAGFALACGAENDAPGSQGPIERDSAGVTIIENPDTSVRLGWTIGEAPLVDIGTVDGEEPYQLFLAGHAIRLSDGRLAVANRGSSEVRVFDQTGEHLDSWGGDGEGPGEFRTLLRVAQWPGDSLAAWDVRLRRLSVFAATGVLGRTIDLTFEDQSGIMDWVGVFADGSFITTHQDVLGEEPSTGVRRGPVSANVLTGTGETLASLGEQPGAEAYMEVGDGTIQLSRYPFARGFIVRGAGEAVIFGPDDQFELRFHARTGGLQRIVRLRVPQRPVLPADIEAQNERALAATSEEDRPAVRAQQEDFPYPETFPAFSEVLVDPLGNVWVQRYRPDAEEGPEVWAVFDGEGVFQGWVDTPPGLAVFQIGTDFILGHSTDAFEVEHIQLWELTRS